MLLTPVLLSLPLALAVPAPRSLTVQHDSNIPTVAADTLSQSSFDWSMDLSELRLVQFSESERPK